MIKLENIGRTFDGRKVLEHVNYTFEEGKIYIIKGVSGSGKSTLFNILAGLDKGYEGEICCSDQLKAESIEQIGYMIQHSILLSGISVMDNLRLVCSDDAQILEYAEKYGMKEYLEKMPEALSGGERQRISLIRCLLKQPDLILADEPTAALDSDNAAHVAKQMKMSISPDRIIIIATHEDCFDGIADEMIYLDYGQIRTQTQESVKQKAIESSQPVFPSKNVSMPENGRNNPGLADKVRILLKRNKIAMFSKQNVVYALLFGILFLSVVLQYNMKKLVTVSILGDAPITTFSLSENSYNDLKEQFDWTVYENFQVDGYDYKVYSLLDKEHSGLSRSGMLEYGEFPDNDQSVLVNKAFLLQEYEDQEDELDLSGFLHSKIRIGQEEFVICGILCDFESTFDDVKRRLYQADCYYESIQTPAVYVPYEKMMFIGEPVDSGNVMVTLDTVYQTDEDKRLREYMDCPFSVWDEEIVSWKNVTDAVCIVIYAIYILLCVIVGLFIKNEIMLELYYRRREIGYLQIIGIPQKGIKILLYTEKFLKYLPGIIGGLMITLTGSMILVLITRILMLIPVIRILFVMICIMIYVVSTIYQPCRKIMKTPIADLINAY